MFDAYSIETLNDPSFAIDIEPIEFQDGNFTHILKYDELTSDKDRQKFDALFGEIGIQTPGILGLVKFADYLPKFFTSPCICKDPETNAINFMAGVERKNEGIEPIIISVKFTPSGVEIGEGVFLLDKVERETIAEENGKQVKKKYTVPILNFEIGDQIGFIEIKTNDDFAWAKFQRAVTKGEVDKITDMIGTIQSKEYCNIGKLFAPHFASKTFPSKGYVVPITDVEQKFSEYGGQYWLKVDCSGLPGYSINFGKDLVSTSDVGTITISENHSGYRNLLSLTKNGSPSKFQPWYLWVKGRGRNDDTVPIHMIVDKLLAPLQAAKETQPMLEGSKAPEATKTLPETIETTAKPVDDFVPVESGKTDF